MKTQFNQPQGSTSRETNKEAIARIFGIKKSQVAYLSTTTPVDTYKVLYDKVSESCWYTGNASGTPTSWVIADDVLTLTTTNGVYSLKHALSIRDNNIVLGTAGYLSDTLHFITIEQFMDGSDDAGFYDNALDAAVSYASTHGWPVIKLFSKIYKIKRTHNIPYNIYFVGSRIGMLQQGSTSYGPPDGQRSNPDNPKDSAFLWYGPTATTWFNCEQQVTFNGIVFGAPLQNWNATTKSQLIDYGTAIVSKTNTNIISCVYYGMRNFVEATGQTQVFKENVGFSYERDYKIINSRDINVIANCFSNPGVIRATVEFAKCMLDDSSIFIDLQNHDGTHIQNCMTFAKKIGIKNTVDANYIGHVLVNTASFDHVGIVLDNNPTNSGSVALSNIFAVGSSAANFGSSVAPSDSGFIVLRKQATTQISVVTLNNCVFNLAATPYTAHPLYAINFQVNQAYSVNLTDVECYQPTDNGAGTFCVVNGSVTSAAKIHTSQPIRENLIPNAGWSWRHPSNSQPRGWTFTNCTWETSLSRRVTSSGSGAVFGTAFRQDIASRTYVFTASLIGTSTGVQIDSTAADGTVTTVTGVWERRGGKYYCIIPITTAARFHDIKISAGSSGSYITLEYAALVPGAPSSFGDSYIERPPKSTQTGLASYGVQLAAGATHSIYPDYAGKAGAYHLYISSSLGAMVCRMVKTGPTSVPTITVEDAVYGGANTFTVTWPDNSTPTVSTSAPGVLILTLTGATYISDY